MPLDKSNPFNQKREHIYEHTPAQASEFLRVALQLMNRQGITTHPNNIALWYDYASSENQVLNKAINQILTQKKPITEAMCRDLYQRFFAQDEQALEHMRQELRSVVLEAQQEVGQAGGNLSHYRATLGRFAALLGGDEELQVTEKDVDQVVVETRETEQAHSHLEGRLGAMVTEMETLRKELEHVREEALTDSLTGVANRKAFDSALAQICEQSATMRTPVCILIADIDHFKQFNDTYGHLVGDRVLRFVASTLKRCVKGYDRPARFGGEEFSVILTNTVLTGARSVAEQIRKEVASGVLKERNSEKTYGRIAISIGVAQYREGESINDLIDRADSALYRAKNRGRNRVETAY